MSNPMKHRTPGKGPSTAPADAGATRQISSARGPEQGRPVHRGSVKGGTRQPVAPPRTPSSRENHPTAKTSRAQALAELHRDTVQKAGTMSTEEIATAQIPVADAGPAPWLQQSSEFEGGETSQWDSAQAGSDWPNAQDGDPGGWQQQEDWQESGDWQNQGGKEGEEAQPIPEDEWERTDPKTSTSKAIWFDEELVGPAVSISVNPGLNGRGIDPRAPLQWLKESWDGYGDYMLPLVALHFISLCLLAASGGLLLGPVMVGYCRYLELIRDGQPASISEATRGLELFTPAFSLGLMVWLLCFLGTGAGLTVAAILSFIPFIGMPLAWLVGTVSALAGLLLFPLAALVFPLMLNRESHVTPQEFFMAIYRACRLQPEGALRFAAIAGVLIGLSGTVFGFGALIGGPVGMWMISIAYDEIFEGEG